MTKILPTVGRVVWFTPSRLTGDYGFTHIDGRKPLAAIVAHVFNDGLVNLSVFDSNGTPFSRTSVPLVQAGEAKPEHGYYCEWMPYQVGQAAKLAESETRLTNHFRADVTEVHSPVVQQGTPKPNERPFIRACYGIGDGEFAC